jgi:hypothetical protein
MAQEYNPKVTNYCTRHFVASAVCTDGNILKCAFSGGSVVDISPREMICGGAVWTMVK